MRFTLVNHAMTKVICGIQAQNIQLHVCLIIHFNNKLLSDNLTRITLFRQMMLIMRDIIKLLKIKIHPQFID